MGNAENFFNSVQDAISINTLIGTSEDLYFDAKRCSVPLQPNDKAKLAKAISGFANADGGTLIYGLEAAGGNRQVADVVQKATPIKNLALLQSEMLSLVGQLSEPPIRNVQVRKIEEAKGSDSGFVLVFVPPSEIGPHRSRQDREYYRRHGFGTFRMEHFEIADMFNRRSTPVLKLVLKEPEYGFWSAVQQTGRIRYVIALRNEGRGIARFPALKLKGPGAWEWGLDGNGSQGLPRIATANGDSFFSGGSEAVVYPGEEHEVTSIKHEFNPAHGYPNFQLDYEVFAESMNTVRGTIVLRGDRLRSRVEHNVPYEPNV